MYKKLFILLLFIFCVTGCTTNYTLNLSDKSEHIEMLENNKTIAPDGNLESRVQEVFDINNDETKEYQFYSKDKIIGDLESGISFNYKFETYDEMLQYSTFLSNCYQNVDIIDNDETLSIKANGKFKCWNTIGKSGIININIIADGYNARTNASKSDDNIYKWQLKHGDDTNIYLTLNKENKFVITEKLNDPIVKSTLYIIGAIVIIIIIIVVAKIIAKTKDENKI